MMKVDDYRRWLKDCLTMGIPAISLDTSARIMAILLEYGNNEGFTMNQKFIVEKDYIQDRFGIRGSVTPDREFALCLKRYVKELQEYQKAHANDSNDKTHPHRSMAPDWAPQLLKDRYNIKFIG